MMSFDVSQLTDGVTLRVQRRRCSDARELAGAAAGFQVSCDAVAQPGQPRRRQADLMLLSRVFEGFGAASWSSRRRHGRL